MFLPWKEKGPYSMEKVLVWQKVFLTNSEKMTKNSDNGLPWIKVFLSCLEIFFTNSEKMVENSEKSLTRKEKDPYFLEKVPSPLDLFFNSLYEKSYLFPKIFYQ